VPTPRLIVVLAALLLPCAAALAYSPASGAVIALVALLMAILVAVDAIRALSVLDSVRVSVPEVVRATLGDECDIDVTIEQPFAQSRLVYVGLALPVSVASTQEALLVRLPADTPRALISWKCTPSERGNYPLRRVHLGASSPWSLWE